MAHMTGEEWFGLAESIGQLRTELEEAWRSGAGQQVRLGVEEIELEFTADLRRDATVEGGVKWVVLSGGGAHTRSVDSGHRLRILLRPQLAGSSGQLQVGADPDGDQYRGIPSTERHRLR